MTAIDGDHDGNCFCSFIKTRKNLALCLVLHIGMVPNLPWWQVQFFDLCGAKVMHIH